MSKKPNVIFIITDQQHAKMLSCAGNGDLQTPHLDQLAAQGVRFEKAHATNPVCMPSRFSMMTGAYPSRIGMESHAEQNVAVPEEVLNHAMGNLFKKAGYQTIYAGKIHLPGPGNIKDDVTVFGFDMLTENAREEMAEACAEFIKGPHEDPFLLVASFINPHDICYLAINAHRKSENLQPTGGVSWQCLQEAMQIPEGMDESTFLDACPALPSNYEIPEKELTAFMTGKPEFMAYAREKWTEREWRHHRWAYARLTERVDAEIGIVLNALKSSGLEENTLVVFTSDHGEQSGAHRVEHKAFLYEESTNVPMIMSWKGTIPAGRVNSQHFVLNGLDIIPTICAAAGIEIPEGMEGKNLLPYAIHPTAEWKRDHIVIENHLSRLVHMGRWKYMVGHESVQGVREMLIDLETDTGEMINRADDQSVQAELLKGRRLLEEKQDSMCYSHNKAYFI